MIQTLASALFVFTGEGTCSAKHEHEVEIISDGSRAYAFGQYEAGAIYRGEGSILTVACGQPLPHSEEPCEGEVVFDLSTPGSWSAQRGEAPLEFYGQPVQR